MTHKVIGKCIKVMEKYPVKDSANSPIPKSAISPLIFAFNKTQLQSVFRYAMLAILRGK